MNAPIPTLRAVRDAAGSAGDASGNCDAAIHYAERGQLAKAAEEMAWAEENARSAMHRIQTARAELAKSIGGQS